MAMNPIRRKRERLEKKIDKLIQELQLLIENCAHVNVNKVSAGSTGNYDRTQDVYWWNIDCLDCGKHWKVDQ